jgi:hypothetical protein
MIITKLHKGQGFGNQLWCYVVTRAIAEKNGFDFGIKSPEWFLGKDFMKIDFGNEIKNISHFYNEKQMFHPKNGADISLYDENLAKIKDNTEIAGVMQSEKYIYDKKDEIKAWLKTEDIDVSQFTQEDICVMNFRGGEYTRHPELFLKRKYWDDAMQNMKRINPNLKFIVITDDVKSAKKMLPEIESYHFDIGKDYSIIAKAKYLIISNSSFAWFPAWLNENLKYCIAPKYWARHNISDGYWSTGGSITSGWMYQDRDGMLHDDKSCKDEFDRYISKNPEYFLPRKPKKPTIFSLFKKIAKRII